MFTAGNTRQQAPDLSLTGKTRSLSGQLSAADRRDFYRFSFSVPRNLHLALRGGRSSAEVDVSLLSVRGKRLLAFDAADLRQENRVILDAGTYFIRVSRTQGNTNYRLRLAAPLHVDRAGNTLNTARRLSLQRTVTDQEFVSPSQDAIDLYAFTLSDDAILSGSVTGQINPVQAQLLNAQGEPIAPLNARADLPLAAGTYYLKIQPLRRATDYRFSLSQTPYFDLAGNTLRTARMVSLDSGADRYTDFVSRQIDAADYYQFNLAAKSTLFSAELRGEDTDLELLSSSGQPIPLSEDGEAVLAAGTYAVRVLPDSDQLSRYRLDLQGVTIADRGGDSRATATRIDRVLFGNVSFTLQDFVGTGDLTDYYRLLIAERLNLNLNPQATSVISGEPVQVRYDLITDTGIRIALNGIGVNLSPGTYYLRATAVNGSATYRLPVRLRYLPAIATEPIQISAYQRIEPDSYAAREM